MKVPFKYLGMIVAGNPRKHSFLETVVTKIKNKLARWKGRFLSFAGRMCLIKSMITVTLFITFLSTKLQ